MTINYMTQIRRGNGLPWFSNKGRASPPTLDPGECGILIPQVQQSQRGNGNQPGILLWLASPSSKLRPTISFQNRCQLRVSYNATLAPGQPFSLVSAMAQRAVDEFKQELWG